jgi:hypothetical protein
MAAEYSPASLKTLKLRPGMFLQAEALAQNARNYELQYLGVIEGKCVMVVPVGFASLKFGMQAGESYVIKGFTGLYDFHFTASVIQAFDFTFRTPAYAYAVLSFPEAVEAKKVRNAVRIKTSLTAAAIPHGAHTPQTVTLIDLSVDGALVRSASTLGAVGDLVRLDFSIASEMEPPNLLTLARICHAHEDAGDERFLTGVVFETTSGANRVALRDFIMSNLD